MGQAIIGFLTSPFSVIGVLISFGFFVGYVIVKLKHLDSQVSNHIPTEIKEVRTELNNRIDRLETKIDNNHNELKNLFIEYLGKK